MKLYHKKISGIDFMGCDLNCLGIRGQKQAIEYMWMDLFEILLQVVIPQKE